MAKRSRSTSATRRRAREIAMQLLYQLDQNPDADAELSREYIAEELHYPGLEEFTVSLIEGVKSHREEIDARIESAAENWSVRRMSPVDRNILRIGAYELLFSGQTPPKVAIDESVEIAKRFAGAESASFINGILDRIHRPSSNPSSDGDSGSVSSD